MATKSIWQARKLSALTRLDTTANIFCNDAALINCEIRRFDFVYQLIDVLIDRADSCVTIFTKNGNRGGGAWFCMQRQCDA